MNVEGLGASVAEPLSSRLLADHAGLAEVAKQFDEAARWRAQLADAIAPSVKLAQQMERMTVGLRLPALSLGGFTANSILKMAEDQKRYWREAMGPLETLRAASIVNEDLKRIRSYADSTLSIQAKVKAWTDSNASVAEAIRQKFAGIDGVAKRLFGSLHDEQLNRIADIARPFAAAKHLLDHESAIARSIQGLAARTDWAKNLGLPVIDAASVSAVAEAWGPDGLRRQLRAMGLDSAALEMLAGARSGMPSIVEPVIKDEGERSAGESLQLAGISIWNWLSIFAILVTILIPIWQKMDSDATEAHIRGDIAEMERRQAARIETLAALLEQALRRQQVDAAKQTFFVARARVALMRSAARSGSRIVAEVFPNQVVELVSERGKWIEVRYFDWFEQSEREGWVLKKYFTRIPSVASVPEKTDGSSPR